MSCCVTGKLAEKSHKKRGAILLSLSGHQFRHSISQQLPPRFASLSLRSNRIEMVYTSPTKKCRIIEWDKRGMEHKDIARKLKIHRTTVLRTIKWFINFPDYYHVMPKTGRPRILDTRDARHATLMIAREEASNAVELQKKAFQGVSPRTIQRRLKDQGLVCRVKKKKPYLSKTAKDARRRWAMEHINWTVEDWKRVVFSDESKFQLFHSDGREYCYIKPGQTLSKRAVKKTVKHGGGRVMVWGCIMAQGVGTLHRINGNMDAPGYVEILDGNLPKSLRKHGLKSNGRYGVLFQQDNDPKHRSKAAEAWFMRKRIRRLAWPSYSPDMNIIEHVWDQLDKLIRARNPLPRSLEELWQALQEEWAKFPQHSLDKLFESMPRRVAALLKARGSWTKY